MLVSFVSEAVDSHFFSKKSPQKSSPKNFFREHFAFPARAPRCGGGGAPQIPCTPGAS